jgi:hypothetical protein
MAPIRFSRRRTPDGVERGLRRTGRRKREENQNTTPEDAFGRKRECIHRRPPLVVSETGRGKHRFRQVDIKPQREISIKFRRHTHLLRMEKKK